MKKQKHISKSNEFTPLVKSKSDKSLTGFTEEEIEWLKLTPSQRFLETTKLWQFYIALGGNLDPEPDPQSPFYF